MCPDTVMTMMVVPEMLTILALSESLTPGHVAVHLNNRYHSDPCLLIRALNL